MTPTADPGTVTKRLTPLRPTNPVAVDADAPARPVWAAALLSFVPAGLRDRADPWLTRLPVIAILVLQAVLTLRLHNVVFNDEGLYINAGHEYLRQFTGGAAAPDSYGGYFSGFPMAYPVFAALLDSVGGVGLVRLSSLLLMSVATLAVGHIGRRLAPAGQENRVRLVSMLAFVLTGAVLFVGNLATYDAACCRCSRSAPR
ncbi:hypothetical protein [Actinoplanes subglobosus]|uniref:Uncharacterized protein n=1 Tax=Actinoplanes subglobosus TaxID=1547892 RepID=A0ABV8J1Z6_9ACTN